MALNLNDMEPGLPEKCNQRFIEVEKNQVEIRTTLKRMSENELVHIHADVKEIKGWMYAIFMVVMSAVITFVIKAVFF